MIRGNHDIAPVRQQTIKNAIDCSGTGLHSGIKVSMRLCPAAPDTGIVFRRTDVANGGSEIVARWDNVVDTRLNTTIGNKYGTRVGTIEHLMAALSGCGVDNVIVEIDGPEVPVMDGSAAPFVFLVECAGIAAQDARREVIEILEPVSVGDGERSASLTPANNFMVSFEIDFDSPLISRQALNVDFSNGAFRSEICRARTFGFEHEVAELQSHGLGRGGSLDNAIVISGNEILNEDGLRYQDEFVRHKILDCIGDLYLTGAPILGHFQGLRSGHSLNNELIQRLFADDSAWRLTTLDDDGLPIGGQDWAQDAIAATA